MDTFAVDWGRSWFVRLLGRNRLVRRSDRLETWAAALAVVGVIVAAPIAATLGTSIKDTRAVTYAQQASSLHQITATALADSKLHVGANSETLDVRVRWAGEHELRTGTVSVPEVVRAGDTVGIWVDDRGNFANAPVPVDWAATEGAGWAVLSWTVVAAALAGTVYAVRRRLEHARYSDWDRDLDSLAGNDDGRASNEP